MITYQKYDDLRAEVEKLRTELSMLVLERDELVFVECKNIEMKYMLEIGAYEFKAFKAQCEYMRLKRKMELIQAKINRQEKVDIEFIEKSLDTEFAVYMRRLDAQMGKMNDALNRSKGELLSDEDAEELKKLYRRVVKAMHPDLHPDMTENELGIFRNAIRAYENGDLYTMRIIAEMAAGETLPGEGEDTAAKLVRDKKRLKELADSIVKEMAKIKGEYPYTMKDILSDPEKTAARRAQFEEAAKRYGEGAALLRERIEKTAG